MPHTIDPVAILPREIKALTTDLFLADWENERPSFATAEDAATARAWLRQLLADSELFLAHLALLEDLYRAHFPEPLPRRDHWKGTVLMPRRCLRVAALEETRAEAIVEKGLNGTLPTDADLAELLVNPFALDDLAERIHTSLPEAWLDDLAAAGQAIRDRNELPPAGELVESEKANRDRPELPPTT